MKVQPCSQHHQKSLKVCPKARSHLRSSGRREAAHHKSRQQRLLAALIVHHPTVVVAEGWVNDDFGLVLFCLYYQHSSGHADPQALLKAYAQTHKGRPAAADTLCVIYKEKSSVTDLKSSGSSQLSMSMRAFCISSM